MATARMSGAVAGVSARTSRCSHLCASWGISSEIANDSKSCMARTIHRDTVVRCVGRRGGGWVQWRRRLRGGWHSDQC